jgi:cytochrome d ubiquinol oxidase subunit I
MATFCVAFGTTMSAFWILALNSWMQTPAGYEIVDGVYEVQSWVQVIFNPSFPYRFVHMLLASALTCSFLICGLSAWQLLRGVGQRAAPRVLRVGLTVAAVTIPLQILAGDAHGLNTLEHQPAKIAAMEGVWETERGAPLLLFAIPDDRQQLNHWELRVPRLASLILTHDPDGQIEGLKSFGDAHPPALPLFFAFRIMVGTAVLMWATSWFGWWSYRRVAWRAQALSRRLLWVLAAMTFSGWVATVAGWYVTEIGRQPYVVYGLLRTADVVTHEAPSMIGLTLTLYVALYLGLIVAYVTVLKYLAEKPDAAHDALGTGAAAPPGLDAALAATGGPA